MSVHKETSQVEEPTGQIESIQSELTTAEMHQIAIESTSVTAKEKEPRKYHVPYAQSIFETSISKYTA